MLLFDDVRLGYSQDKSVLDKVSISLFSPGRYALMGESGSGKTTLLKTIAGLLLPLAGTIKGIENKRISLLFQDDRLLPWCTVLKNVMIAMPEPSEEVAKNILLALEITDIEAYPSTFSGGMNRRVALARALAYQADILLLDEPFSGIDQEMKLRITKFITNSAPLILFTTHDQNEAYMMGAKQIFYIEDRRLLNMNKNS
ncbi:MAG: ATP-binding cassette domain-containing protein [Clostridiales bacterium]|nr:ATP-binding cassette domain-containing protein [Clostridiales bacterium]